MIFSNKITVMRTIALVNTLARLHNFCLGEVIPIQLEMDMENIINWEEGYLALENSNEHRISIVDCKEGGGSVARENSNEIRIAMPAVQRRLFSSRSAA
jgi:hypothetical protein